MFEFLVQKGGGGFQKSKTNFQQIFLAVQPIWINFDFFSFLTKFVVPKWGGGGRGTKIKNLISDQFSRHFGEFGTSWIFM